MARLTETVSGSGEPPNGAPEKAARFVYPLVWGFARIFSVLALAIAWEALARSGTFTPFGYIEIKAMGGKPKTWCRPPS